MAPHADRRAPGDRRAATRGGRRVCDRATSNGWSTGQLGRHIGLSARFVLTEIEAGEIVASRFGREYRIAYAEVCRYLSAKGFPLPAAAAS